MNTLQDATLRPVNYISEILSMSGRHWGELVAILATAAFAAATIAAASPLSFLSFFLPSIVAAFLFAAAAAAWRLYRAQGIAIATVRSLLDLNAADLADVEERLRTRYQEREKRLEVKHEARVRRLTAHIASIKSGPRIDSVESAQNRADDDGWPTAVRARRK